MGCAAMAIRDLWDSVNDEEPPEPPAPKQDHREIIAALQDIIKQLTEDADIRDIIGAERADAEAQELRDTIRRLERNT